MNTVFTIDILVADRIADLRRDAERARQVAQARTRRPFRLRRREHAAGGADLAEPTALFGAGPPPGPGSAEFGDWAGLLAAHVAEHGMQGAEAAVGAVVRLARRGVTSPVVAVLAGRAEPAVARQRALGIVLTELARPYVVQHSPASEVA